MCTWSRGVLPIVFALVAGSPWAVGWAPAADGPSPEVCGMTLPDGSAGSGSGNGNGNFNTGSGNGNFNTGNGNGNFNAGNGRGNFQSGNGQGNLDSGAAASPDLSCLITSMQHLSAELSAP